jgi:hypothetical protein
MDKTAAAKIKMYAHLCAEAGWGFQPFVMDTYGAIRADARHVVHDLITKIRRLTTDEDASKFASKAWAILTASGISRAAIQLATTSKVLQSGPSTSLQVTPSATSVAAMGNDIGTDTTSQPSLPVVTNMVTDAQDREAELSNHAADTNFPHASSGPGLFDDDEISDD